MPVITGEARRRGRKPYLARPGNARRSTDMSGRYDGWRSASVTPFTGAPWKNGSINQESFVTGPFAAAMRASVETIAPECFSASRDAFSRK